MFRDSVASPRRALDVVAVDSRALPSDSAFSVLGGDFCERGGKHIDCEYAKSYKLALRDKNNK